MKKFILGLSLVLSFNSLNLSAQEKAPVKLPEACVKFYQALNDDVVKTITVSSTLIGVSLMSLGREYKLAAAKNLKIFGETVRHNQAYAEILQSEGYNNYIYSQAKAELSVIESQMFLAKRLLFAGGVLTVAGLFLSSGDTLANTVVDHPELLVQPEGVAGGLPHLCRSLEQKPENFEKAKKKLLAMLDEELAVRQSEHLIRMEARVNNNIRGAMPSKMPRMQNDGTAVVNTVAY